ncbi:hypothetical protein [Streptomyces sp. NBC_00872]|uniref:hypothetical protein n=1 Tax=Streptomyces sp. NBC_00872 TaxID=2903686 RepID=UPI003868FEB5|nr:hypothetical protein OG214_14730 [Streptomyces sp. NBC_00872]
MNSTQPQPQPSPQPSTQPSTQPSYADNPTRTPRTENPKAPRRGRILRIELRRSSGLWLSALLLFGSLALLQLFSGGPWAEDAESWTAQWTSAAWWERYLMAFLWPLSVAAGAVQGLRDHRSGMTELIGTTPRPPWQRAARTAGALGLALATAYVLVFLYGGVQVIGNEGYAHLRWLPILAVGALALVAGAWLGMGIARTLPSALTPPALTMASLMAVILVHDAVTKDMFPNRIVLLSPSLAEVHSAFLTVAWRVNAGQTVWLLGLAATGFLLLVAGNRRARLLALLPVVLSAAVAVPLLPASHDRDYVIDKAATALVCEGPVCVTRLHERELAAIAGPEGPAEEALRLLAALPDPPSTVRETVPVWPPGVWQPQAPPQPAGFVPVDFEARALSGAPKDEVLRGLLAGAGTAPCVVPLRTYPTEEEEQRYDETKAVREVAARTVAAAWFLGDLKPLRGTGPLGAGAGKLAGPAWETLRALPADEQRERIAALRTAALSCEGDLLTVLGEDGPR